MRTADERSTIFLIDAGWKSRVSSMGFVKDDLERIAAELASGEKSRRRPLIPANEIGSGQQARLRIEELGPVDLRQGEPTEWHSGAASEMAGLRAPPEGHRYVSPSSNSFCARRAFALVGDYARGEALCRRLGHGVASLPASESLHSCVSSRKPPLKVSFLTPALRGQPLAS